MPQFRLFEQLRILDIRAACHVLQTDKVVRIVQNCACEEEILPFVSKYLIPDGRVKDIALVMIEAFGKLLLKCELGQLSMSQADGSPCQLELISDLASARGRDLGQSATVRYLRAQYDHVAQR